MTMQSNVLPMNGTKALETGRRCKALNKLPAQIPITKS